MGSIRYYRDDFFITPQVPASFKNHPVEFVVNAGSFRNSFFAITIPMLVGIGIFYLGWTVHDDSRWIIWAFGAIFFGAGLQQLLYLKNKLIVNRHSLKFNSVWGSKQFSFGEFDGVELSYFHYPTAGNSNDLLTVQLSFILNGQKTNADLSLYPNASRHVLAIIKYFYPDKNYHMEWVDRKHSTRSVMNLQDGSVILD
jgi:hypothetical protein